MRRGYWDINMSVERQDQLTTASRSSNCGGACNHRDSLGLSGLGGGLGLGRFGGGSGVMSGMSSWRAGAGRSRNRSGAGDDGDSPGLSRLGRRMCGLGSWSSGLGGGLGLGRFGGGSGVMSGMSSWRAGAGRSRNRSGAGDDGDSPGLSRLGRRMCGLGSWSSGLGGGLGLGSGMSWVSSWCARARSSCDRGRARGRRNRLCGLGGGLGGRFSSRPGRFGRWLGRRRGMVSWAGSTIMHTSRRSRGANGRACLGNRHSSSCLATRNGSRSHFSLASSCQRQ